MNRNRNYISIGDSSLINSRGNYVLPNGKKLGEYIPFYFGVRTPMLYVIQNGFNGVNPVSAQDIVYCVTSVEKIIQSNYNFLYSNGHATDRFTEFFDLSRIERIESPPSSKKLSSQPISSKESTCCHISSMSCSRVDSGKH